MLTIKDFKKVYNEKVILDFPQLLFEKGIYWIKGTNGSGKSTLFRSISGIIPFEGDTFINNVSLKKKPVAYRHLISYAEAEPLYPNFLTLKDLMAFVAEARNATSKQQNEIIEQLDMDGFIDQPVKTYSSGMLKKASLGLAFLGNPQVICLDEPFTTIDHLSLINFIRLINDYHEQHGVTFLISSHVENPDDRLKYSAIYEIENKKLQKQHATSI